ncbi:hypothetical protein DL96DRAFT_1602177 [Flagelloscypha sp. PMI_526]|nr:hypothetical protein DL96DRAFT_1602177 [Flagelloscypha sp. PMI_526]
MTTPTQGTSTPAQQQRRIRKDPTADWPTIKILKPPGGEYGLAGDQHCFMYCSQSVFGRASSRPPFCRSICFRKVFPHELSDSAKYPLPPSGQVEHLPRAVGGRRGVPVPDPSEVDSSSSPAPPVETRNWEEGWYLWTSTTIHGLAHQLNTMPQTLKQQQDRQQRLEKMQDIWTEWENYLRSNPGGPAPGPNGEPHIFWGPRPPMRPFPLEPDASMILPFPPSTLPFASQISKFIEPSKRVLAITQNSIASGEQLEFAKRVWAKAWTDAPYTMVSRTFDKAKEIWKKKPTQDDDDEKNAEK